MSKKSKAANEADKIHEEKQAPALSSALFTGTDFDACEPIPSAGAKEADIVPFSEPSPEPDDSKANKATTDTSAADPFSSANTNTATESVTFDNTSSAGKRNSTSSESDFEDDFKEEAEPRKRSFFSRTSKKYIPSIEEQILARISDADLMRYLEMEHEKLQLIQTRKEAREKRLFTIFQLLFSLAAVVTVVFLLRDNPTVLVNILYITGIIVVLWLVKNPLEKDRKKKD